MKAYFFQHDNYGFLKRLLFGLFDLIQPFQSDLFARSKLDFNALPEAAQKPSARLMVIFSSFHKVRTQKVN